MAFITDKTNFYIPGVIFLVLILVAYKKRGLALIIASAAFVGLNDFIGHEVIKETLQRPRPCHILPDFQHIGNCSTSFSFPSNHASNLFTAATLLTLFSRNLAFIAYTCALLVGYSRVYLGLHYPSDVLGGALCGIVFGVLGFLFYKQICKLFKLETPTQK